MAPLMLSKQRLLLCIMAVVAVTPAAAVPAAASKRWMPTVLVQSDPPKPQLPGAYSVMWNLTEGKDAGGMVLESHGTTEVDDAGQGKQREVTILNRTSQLHPGKTYHFVVDCISDWAAGKTLHLPCAPTAFVTKTLPLASVIPLSSRL